MSSIAAEYSDNFNEIAKQGKKKIVELIIDAIKSDSTGEFVSYIKNTTPDLIFPTANTTDPNYATIQQYREFLMRLLESTVNFNHLKS